MQVGFKAVVALFVAISCVQPVAANEAIDSREFAQLAMQAFVTGYVDAEIQGSCLIQRTAENREYVANEEECRDALVELLSELSKGENLENQIAQVNSFREQYGI